MTIPKRTRRRRSRTEDGQVTKSTSQKSRGHAESSTEALGRPQTFDDEPAFVSVGQKVTIQPVQYEPIQCSIHITIPCKATPGGIETAKNWASKMVDKYLQEELTKAAAGE